MPWLQPLTLHNNYCSLEPLSHTHLEGLIEATKDGELWKIHYARVPSPTEMAAQIQHRLEAQQQGTMLPFAVISHLTNKPVGMTSYCRTEQVNKRVDIGWTWYAKSHQRTALNTICKQLLLTYAFETLNCNAVGFRVDVLNKPSQNAVQRLGAKFEGIIRNHPVLPNGNIQDMCLYSILPHEWPAVKTHLAWLLSQHNNMH